MYRLPRWSDDDVKKEMAGDLGRAIDAARRSGRDYTYPLAPKAGHTVLQAILAHPDGTWEVVDHRP